METEILDRDTPRKKLKGDKNPRIKLKRGSFTDVMCGILISEVQANPCLWNDRHNDFKNSAVTTKVWDAIGAMLKLSGEECKTKWKNLKDTFRKKTNRKPTPSWSAAQTFPDKDKWKFEDQMKFCLDTLPSSPAVGSLPSQELRKAEDECWQDKYNPDENELSENKYNPEGATATNGASQASGTGSLTSASSRCVHRPHAMVELEERKINAITNASKEEQNEDYYFFKSLISYMNRLDHIEKLQLRSTILTSVLEAVKSHDAKYMNQIFYQNPAPYYPNSNFSSTS